MASKTATTHHHLGSSLQNDAGVNPVGIYVHIPYCRQRCRYCDFAIVPIGNQSSKNDEDDNDDDDNNNHNNRQTGFLKLNDRYVDAILTELELIFAKQRQQQPLQQSNETTSATTMSTARIPLQSIYFGGGTPSLAPIQSIATILDHICGTTNPSAPFSLGKGTEITMEMDPGTFDRTKLLALKQLGINRISLGVQSLDDSILETMGRFHRKADIVQAVQDIAAVFGDGGDDYDFSYSIDLISGVPGLTLAKWVETLQQVTCISSSLSSSSPSSCNAFSPLLPHHISIYDLQLEPGTVFSKWYDDNANSNYKNNQLNTKHLKLPSEEDCAFMYKYASGYLKAKSYEHYEVSSYAKQKARGLGSWRSRHNQLYWEYSSSWFAVGMGATSFVQNQIVARPKRMDDYLVWVAEQKKLFDQTEGRKINDTPNDNDFLPDLLLKRLRTVDGLNLAWLEDHYGSETVAGVVKGAQLGLELGLVEQNEDTRILRLKDPQGLLYSNYIISSIFAELGYGETAD